MDLPIDSEEDFRALRGALLAARATELSELQRRAGRLSFGYGSESARESMEPTRDGCAAGSSSSTSCWRPSTRHPEGRSAAALMVGAARARPL
jgi:hypothetical protein